MGSYALDQAFYNMLAMYSPWIISEVGTFQGVNILVSLMFTVNVWRDSPDHN
jgi:hypothetical protein